MAFLQRSFNLIYNYVSRPTAQRYLNRIYGCGVGYYGLQTYQEMNCKDVSYALPKSVFIASFWPAILINDANNALDHYHNK